MYPLRKMPGGMPETEYLPECCIHDGKGRKEYRMRKTLIGKRELYFLAALAVLVLLVCTIAYAVTREEGNRVVVTVDGQVYDTYALDKNQTVTVETKYGTNTFVIQDGKVEMEDADCRDGICTDHAAISHKNETIVCLPHKMVISVDVQEEEGQTTEAAFDAMA